MLAIRHLIEHCGSLITGEACLIIADPTTIPIAQQFLACANTIGARADIVTIPVAGRHGSEPPKDVAVSMAAADLVIGLTKMSLAHSRARRHATEGKTRYLSLPNYTNELLTDPCLLIDYRAQHGLTRAFADAMSIGNTLRVTTSSGTDVQFQISGRHGNCCPGFVDDQYRLGSPPDVEANVPPIEEASNGVIVVDGSVTCDSIRLVKSPIVLAIRDGLLVDVASECDDYVSKVNSLFAGVTSNRAYVLAECGVGLNPKAKLTGNMLTDEGALGCVHFGFGSNATVGGKNEVPFHVDFVVRNASLWIDGKQLLLNGLPCVGD